MLSQPLPLLQSWTPATSPNTCGGTPWPRSNVSRIARVKNTTYRFDERQHLVAVTDALGQTTTLERKPDGEVLRINHPDGSAESFTYNALGQVLTHTDGKGQLHSRDTGQLIDSEEFRYDAAANRLNFNTSQFDHVKDNRLKRWRDQEYAYDAWGNLVEKRSGMGTLQTFVYDCENRLVRAETLVNGKLESTGAYRYDSLGRRVGKQSVVNGVTEQKHFLWQGLRMLREERPGQSSLYLYEPGSYAPLARVDQAEGKSSSSITSIPIRLVLRWR